MSTLVYHHSQVPFCTSMKFIYAMYITQTGLVYIDKKLKKNFRMLVTAKVPVFYHNEAISRLSTQSENSNFLCINTYNISHIAKNIPERLKWLQ